MSNTLTVTTGKEKGKRYALAAGESLIGRDSTNFICVSDIEVSRHHCAVYNEGPNSYFVKDLESSNGTFVNESRVTIHQLEHGDRIRVGSTEIVFQVELESGESHLKVGEKSPGYRLPIAVSTALPLLSEDSTYYDETVNDVEASRRFVQVGNDLRFIYHASLATSRQSDPVGMLKELLDLIFNWIAADRGCVFIRGEEENGYQREVFKSRTENQGGFRAANSILAYVCENRVGVLSSDALRDQRWRSQQNLVDMNVGEVMCVPIQGREDILGLIYLDTIKFSEESSSSNRFNEDHLKLLIAMAHQAAVAMENEAYYQALLEKERLAAIGETTNVIAHHVKNTIQGINGGAHLIESGLQGHDLNVIQKGWQIVNRNQEEISRLVIDMLILGRTYEPVCNPTDPNRLIPEVLSKLQHQINQQQTRCNFEPNPSVGEIALDNDGISTAIFHILRCSVQACGEAAENQVSITIEDRSDRVAIVIADSGKPIEVDGEVAELTSFGDSSDSKMFGIGLAVSRKIIDGHNGDLELSHPDGVGNRFVIELPSESSK